MVLDRIPAARLEALAEAAEAYADDAFGQRLGLVPIAPTNIPHFLIDRYGLWQGALEGRTVVLMAVREARQGATADYLKHRDMVRRQLGVDLVLLLLDHAPSAIRRQMVDRKIGFIAPGAQLYVPEVFLDLRERPSAFAVAHSDRISPTTQLMLLAILQKVDLEDRNLTQLAGTLKVSIMSISRSLDELDALQLSEAHHVGRQRRLRMRLTGRELWETVQQNLHTPVRKIRLVSGRIDMGLAPLAGETALARYTMLTPPKIETRAILAARWKWIEETWALRSATAFDADRVEVQTWTYDPGVLAKDGVIDRLSLYLSVRENPDERVTQAAEHLLEKFEW